MLPTSHYAKLLLKFHGLQEEPLRKALCIHDRPALSKKRVGLTTNDDDDMCPHQPITMIDFWTYFEQLC